MGNQVFQGKNSLPAEIQKLGRDRRNKQKIRDTVKKILLLSWNMGWSPMGAQQLQ